VSENDNILPAGSVPLVAGISVDKVVYRAAEPIEIELPDGRKVAMAKPNMSLADKIAGVLQNVSYKDPTAMEIEQKRVKSLLYITSIDGVTEPKICDPIMRAALEQKLGDEVLDALFLAWIENFPPVDKAVLKITKKS
jgi:hypothetical protein